VLQAQEEKCRLERLGCSKADEVKLSGKNYLQPRWYAADTKRESIKIGEGIRWRYTKRYWAAKERGFADEDLPDLFGKQAGI
jgi:hypothetical protein